MGSDKAKLILSMVIFGTIGLVRRYIPYSSATVAFARGLIGALFLLLVRIIKKERFPAAGLRRNIGLLCASGVALGANWILLFEAYRFTSISAATVCYYMAPVFVILASPLVLGEGLTLKKSLCALVAVCGMVLVSGVLETGLAGAKGALCGLGAAVLYAAVVMLNKKIDGLSPGERTVIQLGVSTAALLPYVLLTEGVPALAGDGRGLMLLLVAGVVHTGLAYTLYFGSVRNVPAQTAAIFSYIDPIVTVLLSALVLGERLSAPALAGAAMVIGAAMAGEIPCKKS